ncbi:MAG: N-methyl-L-tryptophan oxidase [Thermoflexales bacterium]|nr:N-methyl-L-tryptophan oxidase [Thermoflexales bacterium]MDW8352387.1 N-methyl-L-tryptophan oxidase [Anaerolineae bacterium]
MTEHFDVIVIGAGVMGSAAAYHLAKDGWRTLLIERFQIAHTYGSSHGESRIFRFAYNNPDYARLAMQSYPHWRALEAASGERLLEVIGGLDIAHEPAHHPDVEAVAKALAQVGGRFELLDADQIRARYPQWRLGDAAMAVFSPDSGFLRATRCVQVMVEQAVKHGATVREQEPVTAILPGQPVAVLTGVGRYSADKVIITGGAWINDLIRHVSLQLPVRVEQAQVTYFTPLRNAESFQRERFPIFIHWRNPIPSYGFPIIDRPGIKVGFHYEGYFVHPDMPRTPRDETTRQVLAYVREHLPDAAGAPFEPTACLYTNMPDEDFVIDFAPGFDNIVICSACSGHGFKFGAGIGRALADLVEHGATDMNIAHVRLRRFTSLSSS